MPSWRPITANVMGYTLSPELVEVISEMLDQTARDGREHGVAVCLARGNTVVPGRARCTGDECSVTVEDCGDMPQVGLVHTHPAGYTEPSLADALIAAARRQVAARPPLDCNAARTGARALLTCIRPRPRARTYKVLDRLMAAIARDPRHDTAGLDDYPDVDQAFTREEVPLVSEETRQALLADPAAYAEASDTWREEMLALLSPDELKEAVRRIREKRHADMLHSLRLAREEACPAAGEGICDRIRGVESRLASWRYSGVMLPGPCDHPDYQCWFRDAAAEIEGLAEELSRLQVPAERQADLGAARLHLMVALDLLSEWHDDNARLCEYRVRGE